VWLAYLGRQLTQHRGAVLEGQFAEGQARLGQRDGHGRRQASGAGDRGAHGDATEDEPRPRPSLSPRAPHTKAPLPPPPPPPIDGTQNRRRRTRRDGERHMPVVKERRVGALFRGASDS